MEQSRDKLHVQARPAMKTTLIIFFSLIGNVLAVTETQVRMKPNQKYMSFFLSSYLDWHQKKFNSHFFESPENEVKELVKNATQKIDHWKTPEYPLFDQILMGQSFIDNNPSYSYRIYLHQSLRDNPFIQKLNLPEAPLFLEWNDLGQTCFLVRKNSKDITWPHIPVKKEEIYLEHHCLEKGKTRLRYITMTSKEKVQWKNPFHSTLPELRTYSRHKLESVFYQTKDTHIGRVPAKFQRYLNGHGIEALLPFDKYSISKEGSFTIYYP